MNELIKDKQWSPQIDFLNYYTKFLTDIWSIIKKTLRLLLRDSILDSLQFNIISELTIDIITE